MPKTLGKFTIKNFSEEILQVIDPPMTCAATDSHSFLENTALLLSHDSSAKEAQRDWNVSMLAKALNIYLIGLLVIGGVAVAHAEQSGQDAVQTFSGEIMDDLCAKNKSHEQMMEQMKSMSRDPGVCTKKCVELGAHYVLYDRQKDAVYKLENPEKAEPFAGKVVRISGTLKKNKIKIDNITAGK